MDLTECISCKSCEIIFPVSSIRKHLAKNEDCKSKHTEKELKNLAVKSLKRKNKKRAEWEISKYDPDKRVKRHQASYDSQKRCKQYRAESRKWMEELIAFDKYKDGIKEDARKTNSSEMYCKSL